MKIKIKDFIEELQEAAEHNPDATMHFLIQFEGDTEPYFEWLDYGGLEGDDDNCSVILW